MADEVSARAAAIVAAQDARDANENNRSALIANAKAARDEARAAAKAVADGEMAVEAAARITAFNDAANARAFDSGVRDGQIADVAAAVETQRVVFAAADALAFGNESSARQAAEAGLQNQITGIMSGTTPGALDSLAELVGAFQAADSNITAAIETALGVHNSEMALHVSGQQTLNDAMVFATVTEKLRAEGAEATEKARAEAAELALSAEIVAEAGARSVAVEGEATARIAADDAVVAELNATKAQLDFAGGFGVSSDGAGAYEMSWAAGGPRMSFSVEGGVITMSVDVAE
jgi:hypothetical protein